MLTLKDFKGRIILAYDSDDAGNSGKDRFDEMRKICRINDLWVCDVPKGHKDWNSAHMKFVDLGKWIKDNTKPYNYFYKIHEMMKYMG